MKRIVLTGGGTGGHVTPNLALIPRLQADGWDVHYIGGANSVEQSLIGQVEGVTFHTVSVGKLRRYFDLKNFTDGFRVIRGVFQARRLIGELNPNIVFSKGGFVSVPVVYGAHMNHVPIVIHESDMTPGLANKLCSRLAKAECCSFPESVKYTHGKGVYTGSPIRPELFEGDAQRGKRTFGLNSASPVLMVVGGSSGARAINEAVREALPELTSTFQVLHLCGKGNSLEELDGTPNYVQCEYLNEEMADAYACADVLISRAGANALFEILALKKPALLIPYPKGASRGDQILNAQSFRERGFSRVMAQEDITTESLVREVISLYHDRGELYEAMRRDRSNVDGADAVLEQIYKYANI